MSRKVLLGLGAAITALLITTIALAEPSPNSASRSGRETPPPSRAIPGEVAVAPEEEPVKTAEEPAASETTALPAEAEASAILTVEDVLLAAQIARGVQQSAYWISALGEASIEQASPASETAGAPEQLAEPGAAPAQDSVAGQAAVTPEPAPPSEPQADAADQSEPADTAPTETPDLAGGANARVALDDTSVVDDPHAAPADGTEAAPATAAETAAPGPSAEAEPEAQPDDGQSQDDKRPWFARDGRTDSRTPPLEDQTASPPTETASPDEPVADATTLVATGKTEEPLLDKDSEVSRSDNTPAAEEPASALIEVDPPYTADDNAPEGDDGAAPLANAEPVKVPENPDTQLDQLGVGGDGTTRWGSPNQSDGLDPSSANGARPMPAEAPAATDASGPARHYPGWLVLAPAAAAASSAQPLAATAPCDLLIPANAAPRMDGADIPTNVLMMRRGNTHRKQVALTFDDGPHPEYTSQILGILNYYHVKATFFCVGVQAQKYPQWVQMAHQAGHEIGNHTYDHFRLPNLPQQEQEYQIDEYQRLIEGLVGVTPKFLRPPGGQLDDRVKQLINQRGMIVAMWDVALNDTQDGKTKVQLLSTSLKRIRNGSVLLAHDGIQATIDMLPELIETLRSRGYEFVTMSELARDLK